MDDTQKVIDQAAAEGIDMEDGSELSSNQGRTDLQPDQGQDAKESDSSTDEQTDSSTEDAKDTQPDESQKDTPFHEHPRFKEISRQNREYRDRIREAEEREKAFQDRLERLEQSNQAKNETPLTPEQEQAKAQLAKMLGIEGLPDIVNQLKAQNAELTKAQQDRAFDEEEARLTQRINKLGLAKDADARNEIFDQLDEHIKSHSVLSKIAGSPGVYELAFNNLFSDKSVELGKRAANKEEIQRREKLKANKSEGTSSAKSKAPGSIGTINDIAKKLQEVGIENIDFDS